MSTSGPADPFDTKPGFFKRLFGSQKPAAEALADPPDAPVDPPEPLARSSIAVSAAPDMVTVEGHSVEDVLAQLRARGVTEVDEATLRASIGDKHPNDIKITVERTRRTVVRERDTANVVTDDATVLTTGTPFDAIVTSVSEVDPAVGMAGALRVGLSIQMPGGQGTPEIVLTDPPADRRPLLFPGATLPVRIDPVDPHRLGIDWANAPGRAG
jgi:hypothetical protein